MDVLKVEVALMHYKRAFRMNQRSYSSRTCLYQYMQRAILFSLTKSGSECAFKQSSYFRNVHIQIGSNDKLIPQPKMTSVCWVKTTKLGNQNSCPNKAIVVSKTVSNRWSVSWRSFQGLSVVSISVCWSVQARISMHAAEVFCGLQSFCGFKSIPWNPNLY